VRRVARHGPVVVAVTPDDATAEMARLLHLPPETVVPQGDGDLGVRIERLWRGAGRGGAAAFFGGDAPDIPHPHLAAIAPALHDADLAMGPTTDGGYWTLAGRAACSAVLADMPWGTASVARCTRRRAAKSGVTVAELPLWYDVDDLNDLQALHRRLAIADHGDDPALAVLLQTLDDLQAGPATGSAD
jgi:glycosyltransferase A (GT-A) superfamily protein (DUF2064 family)